MIVALVVGAGFIVLLIAPTIHRRINENSRNAAESARLSRANELRNSADGATLVFDRAADATMLRDRLLLRGTRAELVEENGKVLLVYSKADQDVVTDVQDDFSY